MDFREDIYSLLKQNCFRCHAGENPEAGYRLDDRRTLIEGDDPSVVLGHSGQSRLIQLVSGQAEGERMPPEGEGRELNATQVGLLRAWIDQGLTWDTEILPEVKSKKDHWAFQPIQRLKLPLRNNSEWISSQVDVFIELKHEEDDLQHAPEASRRELIRRVTFDLTGLPPTPAELAEFLSDNQPDAYERVVDRLLASPSYGEHWGQHWLDVVRFAETEGFEYDRHLPDAWRYRDYVIRSFNEDKPYDRFVCEQIAGDELAGGDAQLQVAAGFHRLGSVRRNAGNQEVSSSRNEVLTERTDIIGSAFLGLTLGCARCHDHKFDPISQQDYYQLQDYFAASYEYNHVLAPNEEQARWQELTNAINKQLAQIKKDLVDADLKEQKRLIAKLKKLERLLPGPLDSIPTVRNEWNRRTAVHVLRRGDWDQKGQLVSMRPPRILLQNVKYRFPVEVKRPKLSLAHWITDPGNPLTARVIVNRLWQYHFGRGIVKTANDLGINGDRPSHPFLLDYLSNELLRHEWRLKPIHRLILLSSTYRQSFVSKFEERNTKIDPENRLLWRFSRRRLDAEEIRDAMLAVSGNLNQKAMGKSVIVPVDQTLVDLLYKTSQWDVTEEIEEHFRRSVYLIAKRNLRIPFLSVFDQPVLQTSCPIRVRSTHPLQALEMLNGKLSNELAREFAGRLRREAGDGLLSQINLAYVLSTGRYPSKIEMQLSLEFLENQPLEEFALAIFNLNAFLYVD